MKYNFTTKRYRAGGPVPVVPYPGPGTPDEAADDPPSGVEGSKLTHDDILGDDSTLPGGPKSVPNMEPIVPAVVEQQEQPKSRRSIIEGGDETTTTTTYNASVAGDVEMDRATSSAPIVIVSREDLELEASSRPTKQARVDDADRTMAIHEQHEDEELVFTFGEAEVDLLEDYDEGLEEPESEPADESSVANGLLESLMFPFDIREPSFCRRIDEVGCYCRWHRD